MEVNCQLHTSAALTARKVYVTEAFSVVLAFHCKGKGTAVPVHVHTMKASIKRRNGGPQSRSGPFGDEITLASVENRTMIS